MRGGTTGMARPTLEPEERLSETLRVALRPADKLAIFRAAASAGMSPSAYARTMLLTGKVVRPRTARLEPEAMDQLRRIGVNLNQAVHRFHATGEAPVSLESAAQAVEDFLFRHIDDGA